MEINQLFQSEIQEFILQNLNSDTDRLLLNASKYPKIPTADVVTQIKLRKKAQSKLPTWSAHPNIVFPPTISYEQSSSEITAKFKAKLIEGQSFADLTGGFGVDAFFFAQTFKKGFHIERQSLLQKIVAYNFKQLNTSNLESYNLEAVDFLEKLPELHPEKLDLIYVDPARRNAENQKVFRLADCEPNVIELKSKLLEHGKQILIKTSPMSDISLVYKELKTVQKVWVVAVENECKEVLFLVNAEKSPENLPISAVNLTKKGNQVFDFKQSEEQNSEIKFGHPEQFLFRPNTSVLKAGAFKLIAEKFNLKKLHPNTHLYTSSEIQEDFTGKIYRIVKVCKYAKKEILRHLPNKKANIATANFPDTPAQIRKKLGIRDGGEIYLFGVTDMENRKVILITEMIKS